MTGRRPTSSCALADAVILAILLGACAHEHLPPVASATPIAKAENACRRAPPVCTLPAPTYAGDLQPILARHCFKCHAGDGVAADEHDFSRVATLRAQKLALVGEIGACAMPPSGEPPLPPADAEALLRWATCGAAQ